MMLLLSLVALAPQPLLQALGPLNNPLKGWAAYAEPDESYSLPVTMTFVYVSWRQLESTKGKYAFADWEDRVWNVGSAKNKHIVFRLFLDYPNQSTGLPQWLIDGGLKLRPYDTKEVGKGRATDYDDPRVVGGLEKLIAAMGKRYDKNPRVAFIQMGTLGFWGEWHTWPRESFFAKPATQKRIVDAYRRAFPNKKVMARYPAGYIGKQAWLGFHDDYFPEDTEGGPDSWIEKMLASGRQDNWKTSVYGGEMIPRAANRLLGKDWQMTWDRLQSARFTFIGPYGPPLEVLSDEALARSEKMVRKMGYEFRWKSADAPSEVVAGDAISIKLEGVNQGVAPFYYPWPLEFALLDSNGVVAALERTKVDIRKWQPGDFAVSASIRADVSPGEYRLAVGIRDPWKDAPAIRFANALPVTKGWTELAKVHIKSGND
jgi:hypothetical protein